MKQFLKKNVVTILFLVLCVISMVASGQAPMFIISETISRMCRNSVLVLSLLLPVQCGMGLNFSIVLGAAAGQIGLILITHWGIGGFYGMTICLLIATVLSIALGMFAGGVFNRTVGQEMITGMIIGYFAKGVFDLVFLKMFGRIIPMDNEALILSGGVGLKNTINFNTGVKYVFDNVWKMPLQSFLLDTAVMLIVLSMAFVLYRHMKSGKAWKQAVRESARILAASAAVLVCWALVMLIPVLKQATMFIKVPVFTVILIAVVCFLNVFIGKTKLGQDIRTCGNDMQVASAAGIKVGRTRMIAIVISTIFAAWGQIIYLQNMGLVNTYTSHEQVGTYAVAALLVGGASVRKATIGQAFLGALLFHILFFTMPLAGQRLFNDAQIGEYFRVFISYGVIALSLALHAWNRVAKPGKKRGA